MLLSTFISRPQQIHTEPGPPSLGHVPACFTHNKLSLSGNIFFSFLAVFVTAFGKQRDSSDDPNPFFFICLGTESTICWSFVAVFVLFLARDRWSSSWYLWAARTGAAGFVTCCHQLREGTASRTRWGRYQVPAQTKGPGHNGPFCPSQTI